MVALLFVPPLTWAWFTGRGLVRQRAGLGAGLGAEVGLAVAEGAERAHEADSVVAELQRANQQLEAEKLEAEGREKEAERREKEAERRRKGAERRERESAEAAVAAQAESAQLRAQLAAARNGEGESEGGKEGKYSQPVEHL